MPYNILACFFSKYRNFIRAELKDATNIILSFKNILIGLSGRTDKFLICILIFLIAIKKIKIQLKL
jgi:hypothetical protein